MSNMTFQLIIMHTFLQEAVCAIGRDVGTFLAATLAAAGPSTDLTQVVFLLHLSMCGAIFGHWFVGGLLKLVLEY